MVSFALAVAAATLACNGGGSGASGDAGAAGGTGIPCLDDNGCDVGFACGFAESAGCAAKGSCFDVGATPGASQCGAGSTSDVCGCDGLTHRIANGCGALPSGYAPVAVARSGACAISDAGGD